VKISELQLKQIIKEAASEYVWGVKGPSRVANQYKIFNLRLKRLISEEVDRLFEQPNVAPTFHKPNVTPAGATMDPTIDASDIKDLERDTKKWQEEDDEIIAQAEELNVPMYDPALIGDFDKLSDIMFQTIMDAALERYRQENQPPPPKGQ